MWQLWHIISKMSVVNFEVRLGFIQKNVRLEPSLQKF